VREFLVVLMAVMVVGQWAALRRGRKGDRR
jgi:hypothetical protein